MAPIRPREPTFDTAARLLATGLSRRRALAFGGASFLAAFGAAARPSAAAVAGCLPCGNGGCCLNDGSEYCCNGTNCVLTGYPCCVTSTGGVFTCGNSTDQCCVLTTPPGQGTCMPNGSVCCPVQGTNVGGPQNWYCPPGGYTCCLINAQGGGTSNTCCAPGETCDPNGNGCISHQCCNGTCC